MGNVRFEKTPEDLSPTALVRLVEELLDELYRDETDEDDVQGEWNPDKPHDSSTMAEIVTILWSYGLIPVKVEPEQPKPAEVSETQELLQQVSGVMLDVLRAANKSLEAAIAALQRLQKDCPPAKLSDG